MNKLAQEIREQAEADAVMLESMAKSLRRNKPFCFSSASVELLLHRLRDKSYDDWARLTFASKD